MSGESVRCATDYGVKKTPSIHMPRWASRITLEITDIRVGRLQEIAADDIQAEGVLPPDYPNGTYIAEFGWERRLWRECWDAINAKRGYSWESNPWVWVISFTQVTGSPKAAHP